MNCVFIYNPMSGKSCVEKKLPYIRKKLLKKYAVVDVYATQAAKDIVKNADQFAKNYDTIVFAGGDGTFNEIVNAFAPMPHPPTIGYIPCGTVNDVARSLKIPRTIRGALRTILQGTPHYCDCMQINGTHYAMYIVAAGVFTEATYTTAQSKKRVMGKLAYAVEALKRNKPLPVFWVRATSDTQTVETSAVLVLVMNGKSVAGFPVNGTGSMEDNRIEVAIVKAQKRRKRFRKLCAYLSVIRFFLFGYKVAEKDVIRIFGKKFVFSVEESVVWDYDGERGDRGKLTVQVVPQRIKIILKKQKIF